MGCSKLREWVGTVTGKGDRWGRDSVGRSAPAFLAASTTALPPPTYTARREAGRHRLRLLFCCEAGQLLAVCLRPVPGGEYAGCGCLQCFVLRAVCLLAFAIPTALHNVLAPVQFSSFCLPLFISMCARIIIASYNMFASCETVLLAAATRACRGSPCAGPFDSLTYPFSCRVQ